MAQNGHLLLFTTVATRPIGVSRVLLIECLFSSSKRTLGISDKSAAIRECVHEGPGAG
ncbi:hypothetical protein [Methylobacter sp.]|uniref:hypothetical protein n=1 Tax=Methylobacter sp. TaxID=2051955 RepID=UPI003DA37D19